MTCFCRPQERMSSVTYPPKGEEPMTRFKIDRENNITAFGSSEHIEDSGGETESFASRQELAGLAEKWPATRLVEIWNSLPGIEPVERFTSQQAAVTRIWKAIQEYLLFLTADETMPITAPVLRKIAREPRWDRQMDLFK